MALAYETSPVQDHVNITASDTNVAKGPFRGIFVGAGGTVIITSLAGNDATYTCLAGQILNVCGVRVRAASTATGLVALY